VVQHWPDRDALLAPPIMSQAAGRKRAASSSQQGRSVRPRNDDPDYVGEALLIEGCVIGSSNAAADWQGLAGLGCQA